MFIPLVVALWENPAFRGTKRTLVEDVADLSDWNFADKTSAIDIHPGPDFDQVQYRLTVSFFEHPNRGGRELVLGPGTYSNIHKVKIHNLGTVDFGDIISGVRFNHIDLEPDVEPDGPAAPIAAPLVVELFTDFRTFNEPGDLGLGKKILLVEKDPNLKTDFGEEFNDSISALRIREGSHYAGELVRLHRDPDYAGGHIDFPLKGPVTDYFTGLQPLNFDNVTSSVDMVPTGTPYIGHVRTREERLAQRVGG